MDKLLLKLSDVAKILCVGRSKVYELINTGELPCIRVGRCIRVSSESLQNWIRDHEMIAAPRHA